MGKQVSLTLAVLDEFIELVEDLRKAHEPGQIPPISERDAALWGECLKEARDNLEQRARERARMVTAPPPGGRPLPKAQNLLPRFRPAVMRRAERLYWERSPEKKRIVGKIVERFQRLFDRHRVAFMQDWRDAGYPVDTLLDYYFDAAKPEARYKVARAVVLQDLYRLRLELENSAKSEGRGAAQTGGAFPHSVRPAGIPANGRDMSDKRPRPRPMLTYLPGGVSTYRPPTHLEEPLRALAAKAEVIAESEREDPARRKKAKALCEKVQRFLVNSGLENFRLIREKRIGRGGISPMVACGIHPEHDDLLNKFLAPLDELGREIQRDAVALGLATFQDPVYVSEFQADDQQPPARVVGDTDDPTAPGPAGAMAAVRHSDRLLRETRGKNGGPERIDPASEKPDGGEVLPEGGQGEGPQPSRTPEDIREAAQVCVKAARQFLGRMLEYASAVAEELRRCTPSIQPDVAKLRVNCQALQWQLRALGVVADGQPSDGTALERSGVRAATLMSVFSTSHRSRGRPAMESLRDLSEKTLEVVVQGGSGPPEGLVEEWDQAIAQLAEVAENLETTLLDGEQSIPDEPDRRAAIPEQGAASENREDEEHVGDVPAQLAKLEKETPPLDRDSGAWVKGTQAARLECRETDTLRKYRSLGIKSENGALGRDPDGRVWRKPGTRNSRAWYLASTLLSQRR